MGAAGGAGGRVALATGIGVSEGTASGVSVSTGTWVAASVSVAASVAVGAAVLVKLARGVKVGRGVRVGVSVGLLDPIKGIEPQAVVIASVAATDKISRTSLFKRNLPVLHQHELVYAAGALYANYEKAARTSSLDSRRQG